MGSDEAILKRTAIVYHRGLESFVWIWVVSVYDSGSLKSLTLRVLYFFFFFCFPRIFFCTLHGRWGKSVRGYMVVEVKVGRNDLSHLLAR